MPVVGFSELCKHAVDLRYGLAMVNVHALPVARGVIESGVELDAPIAFTVHGSDLMDGILPSLEMMARQAQIPIGLVAKCIQDTEQAIQAIRQGCNSLMLADGLSKSVDVEICSIATSCGIPVIRKEELAGSLFEIEEELESVTLQAAAQKPSSWQQFDALIWQAAVTYMRGFFKKSGATGRGQAVLETCKPWHPVEHLILYNTATDNAAAAELAAEGRRVLDQIPGVRATWSGRSVKSDAHYRWCWLIRFAHPAVIDSYREHPDHIAYADRHFRPIAGDRISVDYELIGAEETKN